MCLSTVYKVDGGNREMFARNIQNVINDSERGELRFRDIMGIEYALRGRILSIDLVANNIEVAEN
ncbi:MAG: CooT family nickel-binding protein [Mogibacterium sp.]|nr:CooT family nickel-binding protein [Mogibacterium sp.]